MLELEAHRTSWNSGSRDKASENQPELVSVSLSTCSFAEVCRAWLPSYGANHTPGPGVREAAGVSGEGGTAVGPAAALCQRDEPREKPHTHERPGPPAPTFHT